MIVAAVVVFQVLSNDIRSQLARIRDARGDRLRPESLGRIVLTQGIVYALVAYVPAVAIAAAAYRLTAELAGIPMMLDPREPTHGVQARPGFFCLAAGFLASAGFGRSTRRR